MLVIIRDDKNLSLKTKFFIHLVKLNYNIQFLYAFRKSHEKFEEKWRGNEVYLATSISGILGYVLLNFFLRNPKDLHDGIIRRVFRKNSIPLVCKRGFVNVVSQALYQYFARSARSIGILQTLEKLGSQKVFLVDEFFSLKTVDLKLLKRLGSIVYVSSDLACDFYGDNLVASKLMYKFERDAIALPDLVIACSKRDKLKYLDMGAKEVVYYPNIYPIEEFDPINKSQTPSISIVMRGHWGFKAHDSLREVFRALGYINKPIKVYMIGKKPQNVPENVDLRYHDYIPSRLDYLRILSKSWIGINLGIHAGGSNQRKYDYAMAGLVVFSDNLGARGDLLVHEYTYFDTHDLAAKLEQLLELGKEKISELGAENRKYTLSLAKDKRKELLEVVKNILCTK